MHNDPPSLLPKPMLMPMADLLDRLSICQLKQIAGQLDVQRELDALQEAWEHHPAAAKLERHVIGHWMTRLLIHNALIWSLESDIRAGLEGELGLEEVGRRAIRIRQHNAKRCTVKADIALRCGEFVEQKTDHASSSQHSTPDSQPQ